ncbi:MAG TPA: hypothetical protein VJL61_06760 [Rhodanobacteraceae bacterium]|nr:hypothetical protein [Rhodanobacteraceae bacterium]
MNAVDTTIEAEDLAAAILAHASGAVRWYAEDGDIGIHGRDGDRAWAALAMAKLDDAEESMLLVYAFQERRDALRVVECAVSRGIRAEVARFALVKLLQPSRFAAGAMREHRPKGRRSDVDHEIRAAEGLYREWLRDAAIAFRLVYAIEARPQTCGEIQNPRPMQTESENEATAKCLYGEPKAPAHANGQRTPVTILQKLPVPVPTKEN